MFYKLNLIKLLDPGGVLICLSSCLMWCESYLSFFTCVKTLCLSGDETLIAVTRWWGVELLNFGSHTFTGCSIQISRNPASAIRSGAAPHYLKLFFSYNCTESQAGWAG